MSHIYLIPGLGENCSYVRYKKLAKLLTEKGYTVVPVNPDWYRPLSAISIPSNSILLGFSFGAVIAYLTAIATPCEKVIYCSLSPLHEFSYKELFGDYKKHMSEENAAYIAKEIKKIKINLKLTKAPYVTLAGIKEKMKADFLIHETGHFMTSEYMKTILTIL